MTNARASLRNATIRSLDIVEEMRNVSRKEDVGLIDTLEVQYQNILNLKGVIDCASVIRSTLNGMKVKTKNLDKIEKLERLLAEIITYNSQL